MSSIDKEYYMNLENREKATKTCMAIEECFHECGRECNVDTIILSAYLLSKVCNYDYPFGFTFQSIIDGSLDIDDDTIHMVKMNLDDETWKQMLDLGTRFTQKDFELATLIANEKNRHGKNDSTPMSITELAQQILEIKDGERVADLCCGKGSFLIDTGMKYPYADYYGYEINVKNKIDSSICADLVTANIEIQLCNAFGLSKDEKINKYDKIFSNYPFGLRLRNMGEGNKYWEEMIKEYPGLSRATSSDWAFNALACGLLSKKGRAICIMTNGSTWNSIDMPARKYFIERGMVEAIISLPEKMFSDTRIATTMIILSNNNNAVRMVDATDMCQKGRRKNYFSGQNINDIMIALSKDGKNSRLVTRKELQENEYTLSLNRYLDDTISFDNGVRFEEVIKSITRGAPCTAKQLDTIASDSITNMQFLTLANIQDGIIENNLPYISSIEPKYEKYCLKNNDLLISKNGYPYKIAVATVSNNQKILVNGNVYLVEIDAEKANPYYISAFLESEQGIAVFKSITVGATMPNIGIDKLKKVMIPLPSLDEQNKIAKKYQATLDEIIITKLKLEKAVNRLHHIIDEEGER